MCYKNNFNLKPLMKFKKVEKLEGKIKFFFIIF